MNAERVARLSLYGVCITSTLASLACIGPLAFESIQPWVPTLAVVGTCLKFWSVPAEFYTLLIAVATIWARSVVALFAGSVVVGGLSFGIAAVAPPNCVGAYLIAALSILALTCAAIATPSLAEVARQAGNGIVGGLTEPRQRTILGVTLVSACAAIVFLHLVVENAAVRSALFSEKVSRYRFQQAAVIATSNARLELEVFSDYQCPACRQQVPELSAMIRQQPQTLNVQLVIRHFPLDAACNEQAKVLGSPHPSACEAALAVLVAQRYAQHSVDELERWLFKNQDRLSTDLIKRQLAIFGLSPPPAAQSAELLEELKADIRRGIELGVKETPTLALNGVPLPKFTPEEVEKFLVLEARRLNTSRTNNGNR